LNSNEIFQGVSILFSGFKGRTDSTIALPISFFLPHSWIIHFTRAQKAARSLESSREIPRIRPSFKATIKKSSFNFSIEKVPRTYPINFPKYLFGWGRLKVRLKSLERSI
jgi:hypothetical protein